MSQTEPPAVAELPAAAAAPVAVAEPTVVDVADAAPPKGIEEETALALAERHSVDLGTALRFSRARKGDLSKASTMLAADLEWRASTKPEAVTQTDVANALPSGCWRVAGVANHGFPVLHIDLGLWNPEAYDTDEYGRYVCYFVEAMCRMGERFVVVFDLKGWKLAHGLQMRKIARLVQIVQDHYPERLEKALLMRAPLIFASAWAVIKGFIDPVTVAKVAFVGKSADAETKALEACGAHKCMPKSYGGLSDALTAVPNLPGEPNVEGAPAIR